MAQPAAAFRRFISGRAVRITRAPDPYTWPTTPPHVGLRYAHPTYNSLCSDSPRPHIGFGTRALPRLQAPVFTMRDGHSLHGYFLISSILIPKWGILIEGAADELGARWLPVLGAHPGRSVSGWCALVACSWCAPGPVGSLRWGEGAPLTLALSPPSPSLRPSEKKIAP